MLSIIIPAYNEEKYIGKCLKAVLGLKTSEDFEVIVVNNASTDRTPEVVKKAMPRARIINEPQKGLTRAYNRGAEEAKGDILVFVDADMILPPDHLEKISKEFKKDPKLIALSGPYTYKDGGKFYELTIRLGYLLFVMPIEFILVRFLNIGGFIASGNSAIKKEAFKKVKGFNEELFYGLEPDLVLKIKKLGKVRFKYYLGAETSARRFKKEGILLPIFQHAINTIWFWIFKKPFSKNYVDIR